jgi:methylation protein EvaC
MPTSFSLTEPATELVRRYALTADDLVIEVGSGDGLLLKTVRDLGPRVLGVEPDVAAMSRAWAGGVDTIAAVFGPGIASYVRRRYGPARLVVTRSVRGIGDELSRFIAAASRCLAPGGVVVIHSGGVHALVEVCPDQVAGRSHLPRAA